MEKNETLKNYSNNVNNNQNTNNNAFNTLYMYIPNKIKK
jgi:hypothetical protein